jgi:hypothetical protein
MRDSRLTPWVFFVLWCYYSANKIGFFMNRLVLLLILVLTDSLTFATDVLIINVGEKVTLSGQFILTKGENEREQVESYQALKLDKAINIKADDQVYENIRFLKLRLDRAPSDTFKKHQNSAVKVTGYLDYYYFGPSAFINPAKFDVIKIEKLQK